MTVIQGATSERSAYLGWMVAGVILLAVTVAAAAVWFMFHPW